MAKTRLLTVFATDSVILFILLMLFDSIFACIGPIGLYMLKDNFKIFYLMGHSSVRLGFFP